MTQDPQTRSCYKHHFVKHFRELLDPLDLLDPSAKMEPEELVVRPALLVAPVRLVLLELLEPPETRALLVLMETP